MHLCESLIAKKLMDEVRKKGPQYQKCLEGGLELMKKLNVIVAEDQQHQNPRETGNVNSTL